MLEKATKQTTYWLYAVIALTFVDVLAAYLFSDPMIENAALAPSPTIREVTRIVLALFYLGSFFAVARWVYLAAKANEDTGIKDLKYSPVACVAWFFMPVMNLWKPYFAVKEHYLARMQNSRVLSGDAKTTFRLWWFSFMASQVLANSSYTQTYPSGVIVGTNAIFKFASGIALVLSCLALIKIIKQFTAGSE